MRDRRRGPARIVRRLLRPRVVPIITGLGTLEAGGVAALIALAVTFGFAWRDLLRPALAVRS